MVFYVPFLYMYAPIYFSYFPFLGYSYHVSFIINPNPLNHLHVSPQLFGGPLIEPSIPVRPSVRPSTLFSVFLLLDIFLLFFLLPSSSPQKYHSKLSESPAWKPPTLWIPSCSIFVFFSSVKRFPIPWHYRWKRDRMLALWLIALFIENHRTQSSGNLI